jgi:hypothetical protein
MIGPLAVYKRTSQHWSVKLLSWFEVLLTMLSAGTKARLAPHRSIENRGTTVAPMTVVSFILIDLCRVGIWLYGGFWLLVGWLVGWLVGYKEMIWAVRVGNDCVRNLATDI